VKFVFGTLAAAVIAGVAFVQPAQARCFWNGFETVCVHHMYRDYVYRDYDRPYWRHHFWRDYDWY